MPKKRILVFPFDLLSHYLRCIVLVNQHFNKNEYDVIFLNSDKYVNYITEHGFETFDGEQFDSQKVMACSEKFDFSWLNVADLERVFRSQVNAIREFKPDMVIGDVAPTLKMAAEMTKTEHVALVNGYMTKYYAYTRKVSRANPAYGYSKKVPEKYFNMITKFAENISFKLVHKPFNKLRKKYGLKRINNYLLEMEGNQNWICDLPELFPQNNLPSNYKSIGPLIYKVIKQEGEWLQNLQSEKPIIFICMGSTGNWKALRFLNNVSYSQYTIITAGDKENELFAQHIVSRDFVNIEEVLNVSKLMICHGGNGTIYQGLIKGIYMLCLTSHFEQEWNVHALERLNYGCSANDFSISDWDKTIRKRLSTKPATSEIF
ncbi:MAG: glycosyltransferase [Bacteroidia bacterium]|nr:glycosyltransferase [Bacteroidia bacterium]